MADSTPDNVTITAVNVEINPTGILREAIDVINGLDKDDFAKKSWKRQMVNKISSVLEDLDEAAEESDTDDLDEARDKLASDIIAKTDGCALDGAPDVNDKITNCAAQDQVYPLLLEALEILDSGYFASRSGVPGARGLTEKMVAQNQGSCLSQAVQGGIETPADFWGCVNSRRAVKPEVMRQTAERVASSSCMVKAVKGEFIQLREWVSCVKESQNNLS